MRYVILEHRVDGGRHWDLLVERPLGELRAWRLDAKPPHAGPAPAKELPDHRRMYLTYEGPVMTRGGHVRRYDAGNCTILWERPGVTRLALHSPKFDAIAVIESGEEATRPTNLSPEEGDAIAPPDVAGEERPASIYFTYRRQPALTA